ncbi:UNVERIFIED_CONTAM: hypothetical protein FKN15_068724 [Acipenser sinensis]
MEEAPAERQKGREEPARAEIALRADPLPISKETPEAGPDSTTEGPAAAGVAEGAQEGPPKEPLPRAPPSSDGDAGPETCVAEEGAAETAPEAEAGSADKAEPMQATPAEGPEGEEEPPLPEQELPQAPKAGVGSADNAEPMQAAPAERPEGGKEPPQDQEPPRAPEASVGSADNAEPMQAAPAEGSEGGDEAPHPEQELPQASLSCGDGGFGPRAAAEGDEETSPEAEPTLTLVSEARKGGEEPERAEGGALEADPLPEVQRGQETGPQGPVPVTEGAREEPLKEPPPRASLSGGGEGSGPCAAVGGETEADPVTDAEAGEGPERVYPLSLGEGGEGPERVDPLPSRAEDGPETMHRTSKEGPRVKTRPSGSVAYAERPSAPPKSRVQTVPARVPPPISPAASPGGALGESVKIQIRRNALTHQRECIVLLHREGGGGEPEEREEDYESTCSVGSESLSAPSPDIPAAELLDFLEVTIHRRDKVQLALDKWGDFQRILHSVRSFLRASHASKTSGGRGRRKRVFPRVHASAHVSASWWGSPGGRKKAPQSQSDRLGVPPLPATRAPALALPLRGGKDPSPEAVQGFAEEADPMEEAPAERQNGREEPARAEIALRADHLPVSKETTEAGPDSTTEGPAAAGVTEGAQDGPPKEQLPRAPPSSDGDTGPEPCVAEEGAAEPAPEAGVGSADKAEPMQATSAEGLEGEEEPPQEQQQPRAPEASVGSADDAEPMQATPAEGPEGGKEPPQEQEPPRAPEASVGSADDAEPMQAAPAEGSEGEMRPPTQNKSCLRLPSLAATGVPALVLPRRGIK